MSILHIFVLALVQGLAELLPVSSSAHVIMAEKWLGLDPTSPEMTMLLVMLHTGTMFAVIVYFWSQWREAYFSSMQAFRRNAWQLVLATAATGVVGLSLQWIIKHVFFAGASSFEIEHLFGNTRLIACALAAAGLLILFSARLHNLSDAYASPMTNRIALWTGAVQGLCLPFRGFSRSGATISTSMAMGVARRGAEAFSFALAVVLTPAVIVKEAYRLLHAQPASHASLSQLWIPSLLGMGLSFLAGLLALRWLSGWLEHGRWYLFGLYCLAFSVVVWNFG